MALPIVMQKTSSVRRLCLRQFLRSIGVPDETHVAVASLVARKALIQGLGPAPAFSGELLGTMSYEEKHAKVVEHAVSAVLPEVRDLLLQRCAALDHAQRVWSPAH
jgi:hypothetical protein